MNRKSSIASSSQARRQGIALLSALVCIVVLAALALTLTRTVLTRVREADLREHQLQADVLAESAMVRARTQWQSNPTWAGDVWTPDVEGYPKLRAESRVQSAGTLQQLHVVCFVPADADLPARVERTLPWPPVPSSQVVTP